MSDAAPVDVSDVALSTRNRAGIGGTGGICRRVEGSEQDGAEVQFVRQKGTVHAVIKPAR
jgi:hypothetical protein